MGYKATIRELESRVEEMKKNIEIMRAAIKAIIMEKGETETDHWLVRIPEFDANEINANNSMETEQKEGYFMIRVTKKRGIG